MHIQLYNVATRQKQVFEPANPSRVTVYVCGPTVYGPAHIGNARPAVVFDTLVGLLRYVYGAKNVVYARNITDVDDKINKKAADQNVPINIITDRYREKYHKDMGDLGVNLPDIEPHATAHIDEMIAMINELIARGHAYEAEGHVLFDVSTDEAYGSLSRRSQDDMLAGARVEVAPYKRNPGDFVLWKPSNVKQPGWPSPFGKELDLGSKKIKGYGRPGWHIECSAMIKKHLGETIDIHGGGMDLQFPHHENECAQSRCAHGHELARFWLHNGMLTMSGEKMSKSIGNIKLVDELLADYPGEAIRLALLQGHYRQPLDFTDDLLAQCVKNLDRLYGALRDAGGGAQPAPAAQNIPEAFLAALCDDLNTPKAMAELFALSKDLSAPEKIEGFLAAARLLGILQQDPADWFAGNKDNIDVGMVEALIAERAEARAAKDFARADAARDKLQAMGVVIEDSADGTSWRLARSV